ncbi:uncharacterized protein [Typha latifolia]|uniref:uncharacterized protein isoform X1 n=1 Tax=Typha latifolia TaxID=4733 RepID=UPI003C2DA766
MNPRRRSFLPLLFLLSFAAIALYSFHYSSSSSLNLSLSLSPPNPNHNPNPNPTFLIKLLAFDRIDSLHRCLRSLAAADYAADRVALHVFLDHFVPPADPVNGSAVLDRKLEESRRILELVDGFRWTHGEKLVHYRTANAGLQAQWLEAWWPSSDDEFAFVVEDDLELSPLYYKFLKGLVLKYYYDRSNYSPSIFGASLQRPRFVAGKHGNKLQVDNETHLFLYQMVGTWGQLLFPKQWKEFRLWYDVHKSKGIKPILQGMVTTGWYKRMGERIWTPWFIKFIHSQGYYNIYTNFQQERALSISHRDAGVNYGRKVGPDSNLLDGSSLDFNLWELQPLRNLKLYDFCFREVFPGRIVRSFHQLGPVLEPLQEQKTIILISLYRTEKSSARNLICHLEKVGMQNYILISDNSEFLMDLTRRGYPVIDASQLIYTIRGYTSLGSENSRKELVKEILVKANVIKYSLELGYNIWLIEGNVIPISATLPVPSDQSYDFFAALDSELLFIRSSQTSLSIWVDSFILKAATEGNSVSMQYRSFIYLIAKALETKGALRLWRLNEWAIAINNMNPTTANESGKNLVFWPHDMAWTSVQRELQRLDLWLIDVDSSCTAVFCHQR